MKKADLSEIIKTLTIQLREEEEDYMKVVTNKITSGELSKITQRIQSIKKLLTSIHENRSPYVT
jgi:hypothetical protein